MAEVVGIKFKHSGKVYFFNPVKMALKKGDGVIVETARGVEYGKVLTPPGEVSDDKIVQPLKPIIRRATPEDEARVKRNEAKVGDAMKLANEKIAARGLKMKLIDAEFAFEGGKVVFYFTAAGRIDFRELVKDLASAFHIRIELRQVGIRDETRILGGIAPCGRVCCCASCMPDFRKVTIKMAKTQGLSLNPTKISGLCGRLMCCLEYENEHYSEAFKKMPKVGSEVMTPEGKATVVSNNMLKFIVKVKTSNSDGSFAYKDFPLADIKFKKNAAKDDDQLSQEELKEIKDILD